jgi:hypothetical protein
MANIGSASHVIKLGPVEAAGVLAPPMPSITRHKTLGLSTYHIPHKITRTPPAKMPSGQGGQSPSPYPHFAHG